MIVLLQMTLYAYFLLLKLLWVSLPLFLQGIAPLGFSFSGFTMMRKTATALRTAARCVLGLGCQKLQMQEPPSKTGRASKLATFMVLLQLLLFKNSAWKCQQITAAPLIYTEELWNWRKSQREAPHRDCRGTPAGLPHSLTPWGKVGPGTGPQAPWEALAAAVQPSEPWTAGRFGIKAHLSSAPPSWYTTEICMSEESMFRNRKEAWHFLSINV